MKLKSYLVVLSALFTYSASAQVYIDLSGAYGLGANREMLTSSPTLHFYGETEKGVYGSFGSGGSAELAAGYRFNEHVSGEIGYGYLVGPRMQGDLYMSLGGGFEDRGSTTAYGRSQRVTFSARYGFGEGMIKPYMRCGFVLGFANHVTYETWKQSTSPTESILTETKTHYDGGLAYGFTGGMGANCDINGFFGFFAEVAFTGMSWAPHHSEVLMHERDGQDMLAGLPVRDREKEYYKEVTYTDTPDPDKPEQMHLRFYYPMSSVNFRLGIHFNLGYAPLKCFGS